MTLCHLQTAVVAGSVEELATSFFRVHIAQDPEDGGSKHLQTVLTVHQSTQPYLTIIGSSLSLL
jgi:hypothetical protein